MNKIFKSLLSGALIFSASTLPAIADNFVVVNKQAKVFDMPNTTGYVTLNSKNEEVSLTPGMVFKSLESSNGWHVIEYSPGLRGYLSELMVSSKNKLPNAGVYKISNFQSRQLSASCENNVWKASVDGKNFTGKVFGNAIVFFAENGQPAYSLLDFGKGPVAFSYDNSITKFF